MVSGALGIAVFLCLGVVCTQSGSLPVDIQEAQWHYLYLSAIAGILIFIGVLMVSTSRCKRLFPVALACGLIFWGAVEAIWGIRQVYGFTYSNHSLFALTGSFYNPGPYSGYLAMIFPVCLYEWLKRKDGKKTIPYYITLAVMLLILCVLPAGMSRSAWIAAAASSAYIFGMHYQENISNYIKTNRRKVLRWAVLGFILSGILLGGIYILKKDSADGRLFMWKIAARTVYERPLTGHGWTQVAGAFGQAQEDYFSLNNYTGTEEHVAGSPEYVFNEYLQVAIAWGIPALLIGLLIIGGSAYAGHKRREYGLCGALLSLAIFAFSSYPLQFPAFVVALVLLVLACGINALPLEKSWFRYFFVVLLAGCGYGCFYMYQQKSKSLETCTQWSRSRILYQSGAYDQAVESYSELADDMKWNARFMFEYGHALHKLHRNEESNIILKEALKVSGDPMLLNIIGKNEQEMKNYEKAEHWLIRSTHRLPGRIYPYYLLAKLYADSAFYNPDKLQEMAEVVFTKTPKVESTAIKQMKKELEKIVKENDITK